MNSSKTEPSISFSYSDFKGKLAQLPLGIWLFALAVFVGSLYLFPQGGFDWRHDIGPGARHWWPAPWDEGLILAPWGATILSPLGGLPDRIATAFTNGLSVIIFALVARKLGGPAWIAIPVLISPAGYWLFQNGQTEWLVLAGLLFLNGFDLLFLMLKPQVAIGVLIPRLKRSGDRWKQYLLPGVVVFAVSLVIWPLWPLKIIDIAPVLTAGNWNSALWPWGIPIGVFLLWYSWRTAEDHWGVAATPFLFPYINLPNYLGLLIALATKWPRWTLYIWLLTWIVGGITFINTG